jgi:hypothetical protein
MVRQLDVVGTNSPVSPATTQRQFSDPFAMGRQTVPQAIEDLGSKGIHPIIVAILRFLWRHGKSRWNTVHQPALAERLGISVRTVQRYLNKALTVGLIEFRKSARKPKDRGYLCDYRINWPGVFEKHGHLFKAETQLTLEDMMWMNAMNAKRLPLRFFLSATLQHGLLRLVTRDGDNYVLPRDGYDVLRYVAEKHYGRSIPEDSLETFINTVGRVTPRLLSLFAFALANNKITPDSPGYYTKILQKKQQQALLGPPKGKRGDRPRGNIRTIKIEFPDAM